jgi:hypothetical protein
MEKFMLNNKWLLVIVCVFTLASCASTSPTKVEFDRNTKVETIHYKTFAWLSETKIMAAPAGINPISKVKIDDAIEIAFKKQGYQLVSDPEKADFTISYTLGNRDKIKVNSYPMTYRTGYGRWGSGMAMGTQTSIRQYTEGSLAIDVFDVKSHQPAWRGYAIKRITSSDKENRDQLIKDIVNRVVAQFK